MEEKCRVVKYWNHSAPCCDSGNVRFEFHNGELIAVTRCIFCGKIMQSRMIPTAPCLIEYDKLTEINPPKEDLAEVEKDVADSVDWKWKLP